MRSNVCSANKAAAAAGDSHDMDGDHDDYDKDAKLKQVHQFTTKILIGMWKSTVRTDGPHKKGK